MLYGETDYDQKIDEDPFDLQGEAKANANGRHVDLESEIHLLCSLSVHPTIVRLFGYSLEPEVCIVMEYMTCGNVKAYCYKQIKEFSFASHEV